MECDLLILEQYTPNFYLEIFKRNLIRVSIVTCLEVITFIITVICLISYYSWNDILLIIWIAIFIAFKLIYRLVLIAQMFQIFDKYAEGMDENEDYNLNGDHQIISLEEMNFIIKLFTLGIWMFILKIEPFSIIIFVFILLYCFTILYLIYHIIYRIIMCWIQ